MAATVVIGAQWGDEAKGKIVDYLVSESKVLIRYAGGANAGHTVQHGDKKFKFHHLPSGILHPHLKCFITSNAVIDLEKLASELDSLKSKNIPTAKLLISPDCHVVMPMHKKEDVYTESLLGDGKVGTTGQGIGPVYSDKALRIGFRIRDLLKGTEAIFKNPKFVAFKEKYKHLNLNAEEILIDQVAKAKSLTSYFEDPFWSVQHSVTNNEKIVAEGAQGAFLDLNYGEYPFVTSSHPISGGACLGTGLGPRDIEKVIGVVKAYSTRVGSGPMPTEIFGEEANKIRIKGNEFGTTTGRPRRIGWPDLVALKYSVAINSMDTIALTLLDVLSDLDSIPVCVAYKNIHTNLVTDEFPKGELENFEPVYENLKGWKSNIEKMTNYDELPLEAKTYVSFVEKFLKKKVEFISVGPSREQTIRR